MAKECMLCIGKLPLGVLPWNNVVRITDRPVMTSPQQLTVDVKQQIDKILPHFSLTQLVRIYIYVYIKKHTKQSQNTEVQVDADNGR